MKNKKTTVILILALILNSFGPALTPSYQVYAAQTQNQKIIQSNKYAKIGHDAYKAKDYLKAAQYYEKAYGLTKVKVYKENVDVAYTSYAFALANDKKYDNAIFYAEKVFASAPSNNVKELLADIYFSRGADFFYAGDVQKAKDDFNQSMKYSVAPDQKERVKDALAKLQGVSKGNAVIPKTNSQGDSIPYMVLLMENKVYGASYKSKSLLDRVNKLEKDSFGKTYEADGLVARIERLKKSLLPEYSSKAGAVYPDPAYKNTYIPSIMEQSMGRVTIFGNMPINVFIDDADVNPYKKFYRESVIEGMKEWEKASDNRIKFQVISDPMRADIKVVWNENFEDFPWQPTLQKDDISAEKERMKYRKANAALQVGSMAAMLLGSMVGVPIVGGIGSMGGNFGSPLLQYKAAKANTSLHDLKICVKPTEGMSDEQAKSKIKQISMHQIGHAIGIIGHSPNPDDIMYEKFCVMKLSPKDINTIKEIYKREENEGSKE